ncbi:MAG: rod shape-determining protein MreC [Dehalococcoidia bacterium]|jgi:rod shape-determining protein MreC|uniref:rod shape-determining protein MreC n=1 Tax=Candidatus Amarobacter glycogenicus TaxID=3140699 RepID=UPI002A17761E|nr:rod shape-determining protein MreC [Dehalococcoidia bacterium]MBK8559903.1 rod shape-determining protein MreC [Dehalococcoidia bacterium]MBK9344832.1 rod shape-determining protein MreC [Dehalococcoidia bacterium]MBK9611230.1 rod shape-determining protein MreC [Dehalococcoidia bacterium]MCC6267313.1 rod shape-determining protein MreC [Dehalococcoidia bacterium]
MLIFQRYQWWVASMIGLALFLALAGQVGVLNPFQGVFLRITSPVESVLNGVFRPVASLLSGAGEAGNLRDENNRLRLENEALRNQVGELQQNAEDIKGLRDALNLTQGDQSVKYVAADIVHRDASPFTDVVTINRGSGDQIQVGMVVVSTKGTLLGKVTKVTATNSFVRLITDTQSTVSAEILGTGADGSVKGTPNRGLSFDLAQGEIQVGDQVVTAGLGGGFPRGLPIGRVASVSGTSQDLYKKVTVEPGVRIGTAENVLVRTDFIPESLGLED